jgi:hypothetical protein
MAGQQRVVVGTLAPAWCRRRRWRQSVLSMPGSGLPVAVRSALLHRCCWFGVAMVVEPGGYLVLDAASWW